MNGSMTLHGELSMRVETKEQRQKKINREIFKWHLKNWIQNRWKEIPFYITLGLAKVAKKFVPALTILHSSLSLKVEKANGDIWDYGCVGKHLVVTAGKNFIVDAFQNTTEIENLKYHAVGTGTTAAAVGDTALQTELTTQYNPDNTRATGSQGEGASANVYRTTGTNTVDSSVALTEWGLLSQAATGGGTLLDRQVFSAVNLSSTESLTTQYDLTVG